MVSVISLLTVIFGLSLSVSSATHALNIWNNIHMFFYETQQRGNTTFSNNTRIPLNRYFQSASKNKLWEINPNTNVSDITAMFEKDLKLLLMPRTNLLNNIKYKALQLSEGYVDDPDIKPYNYYNRRYQPPNPVQIESRFSEKVPVSINKSHVQCSTEIFQNSKDVLNIARATEELDNVFRANYEDEPSLLWQFFCSTVGTHRAFPGRKYVS